MCQRAPYPYGRHMDTNRDTRKDDSLDPIMDPLGLLAYKAVCADPSPSIRERSTAQDSLRPLRKLVRLLLGSN